MAEAEAAVRRLQVECEHQLEIERDRWESDETLFGQQPFWGAATI